MNWFSRARRTVRWLRHRIWPGALILLYHYVIDSNLTPQSPMNVTPTDLAQHLDILRKHAHPMSLGQMVQALRSKHLPPRAVAVTFDDGYANNLYHAKPVLERYEIPATVFVTTGTLGSDREFWWDELTELFQRPGTLPEELSVTIREKLYQWLLERSSHACDAQPRRRWLFGMRAKRASTSRKQVLRSVLKLLKATPEQERSEILDMLFKWAATRPVARLTHRPMTPDEVIRLDEGGLIEIGAHTVTHPVLSKLSETSQRDEIRRSKARLEEILGHAVTSFAYPYGSRRDYTVETVGLVQEAGFDCACSNFRDVVFPDTDCYQLPRIPIQSWGGEEFARRLGLQV